MGTLEEENVCGRKVVINRAGMEIKPSHPGPANQEPGGVCRAVEFIAGFYIYWEGCGHISAAWSRSGFMSCTPD